MEQLADNKEKQRTYVQNYRKRHKAKVNESLRQARLKAKAELEAMRKNYIDLPEFNNIDSITIKLIAKRLGLKTSYNSYQLTKLDLINNIYEYLKVKLNDEDALKKFRELVQVQEFPDI